MLARFLIFAICSVLFIAAAFMLPTVDFPQTAAESFLSKLKTGDTASVLEMFGDNTCKCPPRGGYESYLQYGSQEPNLAFLVGKPFSFTAGKVIPVDIAIPYVFPWDKPITTYVDVDMTFKADAPYFLPMEMAYGMPMTEAQFMEFLNKPETNAWKGFTQRLRPSLAPGVVPAKSNSDTKTFSKGELENLLSPEMIPFLRAKDAGDVLLKDKSKLPQSDIAAKLPTLTKATLRLRVVKSGQLKPWMINKFRFEKASIVENGKTSTIEFPLNSKYDL